MRSCELKRLETAIDLLKIAEELFPVRQACVGNSPCKACDPACRAANTVRSAHFWVNDAIKVMTEKDTPSLDRCITEEDCPCQSCRRDKHISEQEKYDSEA